MRRRDDRGFVGGAETIPFGILVFVATTMLAIAAWGTIARRSTADLISDAYLRAYTQSSNAAEAHARGLLDAEQAAADARVKRSDWSLTAPDPTRFGPCAPATVRVELHVPIVRVPFAGPIGVGTVRSTATEIVDPYRAATPGRAYSWNGTICDG